MVIRIGNKRIKVINWLIFLFVIGLIIYLIGMLIFMIPIFNKEYNYTVNKTNYKIKAKIKYKHAWFNCHTKEIYKVESSDKVIKNKLSEDLKKDGYLKKDNYYYKKYKEFGICSDNLKRYKNDNKGVVFNLNDKDSIILNYKEEFKDPYVKLKINNKSSKNIVINSNYNENKVGLYVISYVANNNNYKERLYRKVKIVDKEKPVIELTGDKVILESGNNYVEPGYKAVDNYDGNITNKVKMNKKIDNKKAGIYKITYTVYDSSNNKYSTSRVVEVIEKTKEVSKQEVKIEEKDGITYVNGVILVNKKYGLPKDYDPKVNDEALDALKRMQADAKAIGLNIPLVSGYRSYTTQQELYNKYVQKDGEELASTYSAKPGHSEHQTGLAFDIGKVERKFADTEEAKWIENNCYQYGFIIRYPKDKTNITGYIYEPWHVRYLGLDIAKKVYESGLTLEEYLGVN